MKQTTVSLYLRMVDDAGFDSVAERIFSVLDIRDFQKRYSVNYPRGEYITSTVLGLSVILSRADDPEFRDYQYWVTMKPINGFKITNESALSGIGELVAKLLSRNGFSVAMDVDVGRRGGGRILFDPS